MLPRSNVRCGSRLSENSDVELARRIFCLNFVVVETEYTGDSFCEKTIEKTILRVLGSSEFSHSLGQKATSAGDRTTSDLPPGTDIGDGEGDVREVPSADISARAGQHFRYGPTA